MADYVLPNGTKITGLSEGYTPAQIKTYAISKGYATEADYAANKDTAADWLTIGGEVSGGVGGSLAGAAVGQALIPIPGVGAAIGAVAGGALGTFGGHAIGATAEAMAENRAVQTTQLVKESAQAAAMDAVFGMGMGAAGTALRYIGKPLVELFAPALKAGKDIDILSALNAKLKGYGSSLLPSQIHDSSLLGRASETYAANSTAFRPEFERMTKAYDQYAIEATQGILNKLKGGSREDIGNAFMRLSEDTEKALKEFVDPLYKELDKEGGLLFNTKGIKQTAQSIVESVTSGGVGRVSPQAAKTLEILQAFPDEMTPALFTRQVQPALSTLESLAKRDNTGQAARMVQALKEQVSLFNQAPHLVDATGVVGKANAEALKRVGANGAERVSGEYKTALAYLKNMRTKMSFTETRQELSYLKQMRRDMENPAAPNGAAAALYGSAIAALEDSMGQAAKKFNPELYAKYRYVSDFYKKAEESIYAPFMKDALRTKDVATVGDLLSKVGSVTPIKELEGLVKQAEELKVAGGGTLREGVTKAYLENIFRAGDLDALHTFNKNMTNPRYRDTFNAIVPKDTAKLVTDLAVEADILARFARSSSSSIAIAGREFAAAESPGKVSSIVFGMLPGIVKKQLSNAEVAKKLAAMKAANAQLANGKRPADHLLKALDLSPALFAGTGVAVGAAAEK